MEALEAFLTLKEAMIEAPILDFPDMSDTFIVETGASGYGIGGSNVKRAPNRIHQ